LETAFSFMLGLPIPLAIPIIFITGHGDIPMSVQAMKAGAVDFLTKPFRDQVLLDAIHKAIQRDLTNRKRKAEQRLRYELLSPREREVLTLIVTGLRWTRTGDLLFSSYGSLVRVPRLPNPDEQPPPLSF
jgi:DNA-binding NarL/FixJ family response regulator